MKTIKGLFIEKQHYFTEYQLNNRYYLWIEALDENGGDIQEEEFDINNIYGVLIELHDRKNKHDTFCEWNKLIDYEYELEYLESLCRSAIQQYEQNQGDIYTVYIYKDEYGLDIAFTEDFLNKKQAIRYADKFVKHYPRVEVLAPNDEKIY